MQVTVMGVVAVLVVVVLYNMIKILKEYERGVIFFLGRFYRVRGPDLIILVPFVQTLTKVDLRVISATDAALDAHDMTHDKMMVIRTGANGGASIDHG